ncbi:MAG TPA: hypothetical protein DD473_09035 [Planctomycetaceae bacterium]|nr:hypothetical protein [Planctomycetaceae bacterium]|tara:strand:- start:118 stop:1128 length:1011 start_codon:yes stop_codon:yes gene_type:complete
MLSEFAFTPSVFDENAQEDKDAWREQIREINLAMFPRIGSWPIVISDLFEGGWSELVQSYVDNIEDHRSKTACQSLLTQGRKMLVKRPCCHDAWPGEDDAEWCREAQATDLIEPIDRIISTRNTIDLSHEEFHKIRCLDETNDSGFWNGISNDSPSLKMIEQIDLLRKICLHSEWIAFINPYALGNELDFTEKLIRHALAKKEGFKSPHIEVHVMSPSRFDSADNESSKKKAVKNFQDCLGNNFKASNTIQIYFWPKLLDRIFIGGSFQQDSDGKRLKAPRWGVAMNHVARNDHSDNSTTEWKLLSKKSILDWFYKYVSDTDRQKPTPCELVISNE